MKKLIVMAAAAVMGVFEYFINKKNMNALENFSLAASMLAAMAFAVIVNLL